MPSQMIDTYINAADKNSELVHALKRALMASNVNVVGNQSESKSVLNIINEQQKKRVLSVDTQGRAREYEINYQLSFNMSFDESAFSIEQQTIKSRKIFLFDTEDVLGKSREQATLLKDMQQDMVRLIMLRLQAAAKQ